MRAIFFMGACLFVWCDIRAQSLEPFELYDYLDPRLRKSFLGDSINFLNLSVNSGAIFNYQYNNTFTNEDYLFARAAASYFVKDFQFNAKYVQLFSGNETGTLHRARAQIAYYVLTDEQSSDRNKENRFLRQERQPSPLDTLISSPDFLSTALRFQLTYNEIQDAESTDHQLMFDYSLNIKSSYFIKYIYANFFGAWMLNRKEFLYGLSAKGSYPFIIERTKFFKSFGYGYNVLRSKLEDVDRWGNFKVEVFVEVGYRRFSVFLTYSWARELHYKFNNREFSLFVSLPLVSDLH